MGMSSKRALAATGLTSPSMVTATVGGTVTLEASYTSTAQLFALTWMKIDADGSDERKTTVYLWNPLKGEGKAMGPLSGRAEKVDQASLLIRDVEETDGGKYSITVIVENEGQEERTINLKVQVPPTVAVGPQDPYQAIYKTDVSLNCIVANAKPEITSLYWLKNRKPVDTTASGPSAKYKDGNTVFPSLVIRNISKEDAGTYTCVADHVTGPVEDSMVMKVSYPAQIVNVTYPQRVYVGDKGVRLFCAADGNPHAEVTWSKEGALPLIGMKALPGNNTLVIPVVRRNDSGEYICTARNGVGRTDSKRIRLKLLAHNGVALAANYTQQMSQFARRGRWHELGSYGNAVRKRRKDRERENMSMYYKAAKEEFEYLAKKRLGRKPPEIMKKPGKEEMADVKERSDKGGGRKKMVRAIYSYTPQDEDELTLKVGDVIEVIRGENGGWWFGYLNGQLGLFPSNYVEVIDPEDLVGENRFNDDKQREQRDMSRKIAAEFKSRAAADKNFPLQVEIHDEGGTITKKYDKIGMAATLKLEEKKHTLAKQVAKHSV
ncbi:hypothetical protein Bbelb_299080 [Branchiostoma belcheri]|nr:hypothetical protein Bbelb_299080 [Branchiostoma belcheri]